MEDFKRKSAEKFDKYDAERAITYLKKETFALKFDIVRTVPYNKRKVAEELDENIVCPLTILIWHYRQAKEEIKILSKALETQK